VRLLFILDDIASHEKVEISDEDLAGAYKAVAARAGKSEDEEAPDKEADAIFEKNRNYIEKDMGKSQNQWRKLWKSQGKQGKKELLSFFGMDQG